MMDLPEQIAFGAAALGIYEDSTTRDDSFAALVHRQSRFIFQVAYSVLRSVPDADDVVQEAFLKLYRTRGRQRMVNERAFLARVAWRLAADRLPHRRAEEPPANLEATGQNPEQAAIAADWTAAVHRLIDSLPEELRLPLALSSVDEMTSQEIAAVMGIPEGTVRSRMNRARQVLKEKLRVLRAGAHGQ